MPTNDHDQPGYRSHMDHDTAGVALVAAVRDAHHFGCGFIRMRFDENRDLVVERVEPEVWREPPRLIVTDEMRAAVRERGPGRIDYLHEENPRIRTDGRQLKPGDTIEVERRRLAMPPLDGPLEAFDPRNLFGPNTKVITELVWEKAIIIDLGPPMRVVFGGRQAVLGSGDNWRAP